MVSASSRSFLEKGPRQHTFSTLRVTNVFFSLGFLTSPFGAGAYKDPMATRLVLEFTVPPELLPHLQRLDQWVLAGAVSQREVLFPDWSEQDVIKISFLHAVFRKI